MGRVGDIWGTYAYDRQRTDSAWKHVYFAGVVVKVRIESI
jgi:hypothetical protein